MQTNHWKSLDLRAITVVTCLAIDAQIVRIPMPKAIIRPTIRFLVFLRFCLGNLFNSLLRRLFVCSFFTMGMGRSASKISVVTWNAPLK